MKVPDEWHRLFYRASFYNPSTPASIAAARKESRFILSRLKLPQNARLLDLCCGQGRHAVPLALKGLDVTGCDLSAEYLKEAARVAAAAKARVRFVRSDMRRLPFRAEFDAVINMFTSFGYFRRSTDDLLTLKGIARALRPGGLFLIDLVHFEYVKRHFRPRSWERLEDGAHLLTETELCGGRGMNNSWTLLRKGRAETRTFFVRGYTRKTLAAALRKAGMEPVKFWGGFGGERLTADSDRLIALARRPGRAAA